MIKKIRVGEVYIEEEDQVVILITKIFNGEATFLVLDDPNNTLLPDASVINLKDFLYYIKHGKIKQLKDYKHKYTSELYRVLNG